MPSEQTVQKQIIKYLESYGYYVVKVVVANKRGVPDIIACSPQGKFIGIEVKAPGKLAGLTKLQKFRLGQINETGGLGIVADSLEMVKIGLGLL